LYCKECVSEISRNWRINNIKKVKENNKKTRLKMIEKDPEGWVEKKKDYYYKNLKRWRFKHLHNTYGITLEQFEKMIQVEKCPICGNDAIHEYEGRGCKSGKIVVDHNHETGQIRGFICTYCNVMLGNAKDNIQTLQNAIQYLQTHSA